jgi:ribose transport system substrate-binding protein
MAVAVATGSRVCGTGTRGKRTRRPRDGDLNDGGELMRGVGVRVGFAIAAVTVVALSLAACGGGGNSSSGGGSSSTASSGGSSGGEVNKTVIAFTPTTENNYVALWQKAAKEILDKAGYTIKFYDNNFEQSEEDQQVQQVLASGETPGAFVYWPSDNEAGIASARRLAAVAPVIQTNNAVLPEAEEYIAAFAGVNDYADGVATGELGLKMRESFETKGMKMHGEGGNAIIVTYGGGYQAGIDRAKGIEEATKGEPFNVIETVETGFTVEEAYKSVAAVLPKLKSEGIDFVLAVSEFPALGAIEALKEAGYKPGEDVGVVTGNCQTNFDHLVSGEEFGTILQSPVLEGKLAAHTLMSYLENGEKTEGPETESTLPASETTEPKFPEVPAYRNYFPLPLLEGGGSPKENEEMIADTKLWGQSPEELCAK